MLRLQTAVLAWKQRLRGFVSLLLFSIDPSHSHGSSFLPIRASLSLCLTLLLHAFVFNRDYHQIQIGFLVKSRLVQYLIENQKKATHEDGNQITALEYWCFIVRGVRSPICAGFAGVADFNFWQSGALLALNTFGAFLVTALTLPLACTVPDLPTTQSHSAQLDSLSADAPAHHTTSAQPVTSSEHESSADVAFGSAASDRLPKFRLPVRGDSNRPRQSREGPSYVCDGVTAADARERQQGTEQLHSGGSFPTNKGNLLSTEVMGHTRESEASERPSANSSSSSSSSRMGTTEQPLSVCLDRQGPSTAAVIPDGQGHSNAQCTEVVGVDSKNAIHHYLLSAALIFLTVRTLNATVSTISAAVQRRHLMVWALFAPKFLFDACILIVCDVSVILACTLALAAVHRS